MLFETRFHKKVLLVLGKFHIAKMRVFFRNFDLPHFCTVFSPICGTQKKMGPGTRNQGFWDLLAHFEVQGARNFVVRDASGVGVCGEYHGVKCRVNDVFLRCVFEWYDAKSQDHCSK